MTNLSGTNLNNGSAVGPQGEGRDSPSTFPAYPAYRDSGVEWLGEVPHHWESRRLKFLFSLQKRPVVDSDGIVTCFRDGAVTLRANRRTDGFTNAEKEIGYQGIRRGDLVIHAMDAFAGAIGVSDSDGKSSPVYSACTPNEGVSAYYYARLLRHMALAGFVSSLAKGIRERSTDFRWSDASEICLPLPSISEQTQIARFLDHETARIDALIEEQQRLIELLKEKRQAVISHAVTKGLDPTVPMKDSGVEWLGEVPAHWVVRKGGYIGMLFGSEAVPEYMVNDSGSLPFLKVGSLSADTLSIRQWDFFVDASIEKAYRPRSQFVVFPKRGAAIFLNKVNVVEVSALLDPNLMGWEMETGNNAYYFANVLKCRGLSELADVSTVPQINNKHISPEKFPVPPFAEQNDIVAFLDTEITRFDQLVAEAEQGVSLLQERRSALISAAVTGKIDVRDWQPPANTQAPEPVVAEAN